MWVFDMMTLQVEYGYSETKPWINESSRNPARYLLADLVHASPTKQRVPTNKHGGGLLHGIIKPAASRSLKANFNQLHWAI